MTSPSGGYDPNQTYGTQPTTGATTIPSGQTDLYLPTSLANQPIFVGTNKKPLRWDNSTPFTPSPITITASHLVQQYAGLSVTDPTAFAAVQSLLYSSGSYSSKPTWGVWTTKDSDAFSKALTAYIQVSNAGVPITFEEWASNAAKAGQAGAAAQPKQTTVTDPAAIQQAAQSAAEEAIGRGLTPTELDTFVKSFQAKQQAAETSTASTVTAPDLSSDALAYAQSTAPGEYQAQQSTSYQNALLNMFLPSSSARPSSTPVPNVGGGTP